MKSLSCLRLAVLLLCCVVTFAGCKKRSANASPGKEPEITGSPADPPVAIAPQWKPGRLYVMRMESAQTMQLPNFFGGRGQGGAGTNNPPVENNFAQEYSLSVTNAADGNRGIEMEILAIELQTSRGDQQQINYDSQNKVAREGGPMADAFDKLIGGKIHYLLAADNKVLKVEGVRELFDRVDPPVDNADPNAPGAGRRAGARTAGPILRGIYNEGVFKQMLELTGAPTNAPRVGESWSYSRDITAPMIGQMTVTTTNTLRGWQEHDGKKCARVEFTGGMTSSGQGGTLPFGGRLAVENGTVSGRYWYAQEIGLPIAAIIDQSYTIAVSGMGGGRNPNANIPQDISAPVRQTVSIKLLDVKTVGSP